MWWYYKCVNLVRVLIQGSKVILCVTWKCLARAAVQAGLRPVPTLWLDQPPLGMSKKTDCLKRRASGAPFLFSLDSIELCGTRRSYASRFRNCALQRAPVRWTLTSEPTIGGSLRLCQSRNGATNSTIAEESFPVTSREQPKEPELTTWHPKQRTHAGKRNQRIQPALNQQKASNKPTFLILTKPLKFDLNAVTKQTYFVRDLFLVS